MPHLDEQAAIDRVTRLMAIPGKSCEESLIAQAVVRELQQAGIPESCWSFDTAHRKSPSPGEVGNLIVKLPGNRRRPRLMLSAHMDTVPICVGCQPTREGRTIVSANKETGLGADDRAGVAAVLTAVLATLDDPERPPLTLCFFIQEEIGLQGSRFLTLSKLAKPAMALNFDGGDPFKMTVGATGGERLKVTLQGIPAHAGLAPENGASALNAASLAIASLVEDGWLGAVSKSGKVGTSNIGVVRGGVATNVVADSAEVTAETRSHDGKFRKRIADAIERAFVRSAKRVKSKLGGAVQAHVERRVDYESFRLDEAHPAVHQAALALEPLGRPYQQAVTNGGVDANWLNHHGIPTVTIGCGQRNVHTVKEMLDLDDYLAACQVGMNFILPAGAAA